MTVTKLTNKSPVYSLNGVNSEPVQYSFPFFVRAETHLKVYVKNAAGVVSQLLLNSVYTVPLSSLNNESGGVIEFATGKVPADAVKMQIYRVMPLLQQEDITNGGAWYPETHEQVFDYLMMVMQQLDEKIERCVQVNPVYLEGVDPAPSTYVAGLSANIDSAVAAANTAIAAETAAESALAAAIDAQLASESAAANASAASLAPVKASAAEIVAGTEDGELWADDEGLPEHANGTVKVPAKYISSKALALAKALGLEFPQFYSDLLIAADKKIFANNGDTNKPCIYYDEAANKWKFSNDGGDGSEMGSAAGSSGSTVYAVASHTDDYYTATISGLTELSSGLFIRIAPDISGLAKIKINGGTTLNIYGPDPVMSGYCYDLYYDSVNACFISWRKSAVSGPGIGDPYATSGDYSKGWDVYGNVIANVVAVNRASEAFSTSSAEYNTVTAINNPFGTTLGGGCNMVMLPDGKIYCVPYLATMAKKFDPSTDQAEDAAASGVFSGTGIKYSAGLLLPSGKVLLIPCNNYHATTNPNGFKLKLYDYTDDSYEDLTMVIGTGTAGTVINGGGVVLPSGKVLITPAYAGAKCYLLDLVANTVISPAGLMDGTESKSSPVLAPNGKVYVFTGTATYYEYNPETNCIATLTGNSIISGIAGTTQLSNGLIWPGNSGVSNDALFSSDRSFAYLGAKIGIAGTSSCLLPSGRIFIAGLPIGVKVYDPITNSMIIQTGSLGTLADTKSQAIIARHCMLLRDGRVLVSSYNICGAGAGAWKWYIFSNAAYAAGTTYAKDVRVSRLGVNYISLSGGNIGHAPESSPAYWLPIQNFPNGVLASGILNKR